MIKTVDLSPPSVYITPTNIMKANQRQETSRSVPASFLKVLPVEGRKGVIRGQGESFKAE